MIATHSPIVTPKIVPTMTTTLTPTVTPKIVPTMTTTLTPTVTPTTVSTMTATLMPTVTPTTVSEIVDDHGDSREEATSVTVGETVRGVLNHKRDEDVFVFQAEAGAFYLISVELEDLSGSVASLTGPDGEYLAGSSNIGHETFDLSSETKMAGSHYFRIFGGASDDATGGSFTLAITLVTPIVVARSGDFASASAGYYHTCGVRADGAVECWGDNQDFDDNFVGQATPPAGTFSSVSAGGAHTCGVQTDGTVVCWGDISSAQATPPAGAFSSVSAGATHTCGVQNDGTVVCWGDNSSAQATPPAGAFSSVSAGVAHTCGVQTDGMVVCWGNNEHDQATSPAGAFSSVSAGATHTCGVKTSGAVACWGDNTDFHGNVVGQASPPPCTETSTIFEMWLGGLGRPER